MQVLIPLHRGRSPLTVYRVVEGDRGVDPRDQGLTNSWKLLECLSNPHCRPLKAYPPGAGLGARLGGLWLNSEGFRDCRGAAFSVVQFSQCNPLGALRDSTLINQVFQISHDLRFCFSHVCVFLDSPGNIRNDKSGASEAKMTNEVVEGVTRSQQNLNRKKQCQNIPAAQFSVLRSRCPG